MMGRSRRCWFITLGALAALAACVDELPIDERGFVDVAIDVASCRDLLTDSATVFPACRLMVGEVDTLRIEVLFDSMAVEGLRVRWFPFDSSGLVVNSGFSLDSTLASPREQTLYAEVVPLARGKQSIAVTLEPSSFVEPFTEGFIDLVVEERWAWVDAGGAHTCGFTASDTAYALISTGGVLRPGGEGFCWGAGFLGQLGNGNFSDAPTPSPISGGLRLSAVSAASEHTCGTDLSGILYCWGFNGFGQLGIGNRLDQFVPRLSALAVPFGSVSSGSNFSCGVTQERGGAFVVETACFGSNSLGQLGCDALGSNPCPGDLLEPDFAVFPVRLAPDTAAYFLQVTAGRQHACGLLDLDQLVPTPDSTVLCWGSNEFGQLGFDLASTPDCGGIPCQSFAVPVQGPGGGAPLVFAAIDAGDEFTCAVTPIDAGGEVWCWGRNNAGQLGDGAMLDSDEPVRVTGAPGVTFVSISAGGSHACAVTNEGDAYCWGDNSWGQLGDGSSAGSSEAVAVAGSIKFERVSAGGRHTCGVASQPVVVSVEGFESRLLGGGLYCWGANDSGQLGDGTGTDSDTPVRVSEPGVDIFS